MNYTLGSLFDGSGGFPLAGTLCGIEPRWASEVEPYPIAVTRSRFPNMHHLGDISKVDGAKIEPVDIITFGSPCQDLSVAGKRAGLKHEANGDDETTRSGLFMEAVRIIKEMREATNGKYPRFAIWENVPGAFSSNNGEDFRIVCEELIKVVEPGAFMPPVPAKGWAYADCYTGDGWSLAYRVFDAQYWGVPQRRRRIHLIVDFRGERAHEILFEREGLRGYFETGRTPWEETAGHAGGSAATDDRSRTGDNGTDGDSTGGRGLDGVIATDKESYSSGEGFDRAPGITEGGPCPTLQAGGAPHAVCYTAGFCTEHSAKARGVGYQNECAPTLRAGVTPAVCIADHPTPKIDEDGVAYTLNARDYKAPLCVAYSFDSLASNSMKSSNPHSGCRQVEVAKTLDTTDPNPSKNQGGIAVVQPVVYDGANITSPVNASNPQPGDPCHTLSTDSRNYVVACYDARGNGDGQTASTITGDHENRVTDYTNVVLSPTPIHDMTTRFNGRRGNKADGKGNGLGVGEPDSAMYTLTAGDRHGVVYATDVGFFSSYENQSPTLLARQYKDPHLVTYPENEVQYIVRRLTPTECARLQGFADWWGYIEPKTEFTTAEYRFWLDVRNTHAVINGKTVKDYTERQMLTWYNKLYTDSAEYKMWGNGIALPPALYCIQGIVDTLNRTEPETEPEDDEAWML